MSDRLPNTFVCPVCGYNLASSPVWTCSECGYECTHDDAHRSGCSSQFHRLAAIHIGVGATLVALMAVASFLLIPDLFTATVHTMWAAAIVGSSILLGLALLQIAQKPERMGWRVAWLRASTWLHVPWIGVPLLWLAMALLRSVEPGTEDAVALLYGPAWVIMVVVSIWRFIAVWREHQRKLLLPTGLHTVFVLVLAMLLFIASMWLGVHGGLLGLEGVEWLPRPGID